MKLIPIATGAILATVAASHAFAQDMDIPFRTGGDAGYAALIREAMQAARRAGMIHNTLHEGTDPHGAELETF